MELLLRRDQKSGMMGGIKFLLTAKARLTDEESRAVKEYKMGDIILYEQASSGPNLTSVTSVLKHRYMVPRVQVSDLVNGKTIETKDICEVMGAEEQIMEAAGIFHKMLTAARTFGGETVHTFAVEE